MAIQIPTSSTAVLTRPIPQTAPPASVRAGRSRIAQTFALASLGAVSGALLVWQLGTADLVATVVGARPGWLAVAVAASMVPFLGAALGLVAFAPGRLPLGRTTVVQVASSYAAIVLPPTVGQLAVNAQFLRRLGHRRDVVAATVALTQAASLVVTLVLLTIALAATGADLRFGGVTPTTVVLVVLLGLGIGLGLAVLPRLRRRVVTTVAGAVRELGPRLHDVSVQPARLAAGIGGALLVSGGYVLALDASLRAVGTTLPLAQTAIVVLAGTALGSAAPTPGGTVAVEAALAGGLVAAGVPAAAALPAVLLYRAVTLWLRVAPGWVAMTVLRRRGAL